MSKPFVVKSTFEPAGDQPTHSHEFGHEVKLKGKEVAIGSGCCNDGYAKKGAYAYSSKTSYDQVGLPYITLMACQKD